MIDYVAKYPGSFKAPCKLVFEHLETDSHHAGSISITFGDDLVNAVLNAILNPPDPGLNEEGKQLYRAHIVADMRLPKFRNEKGEIVPYQFVFRRHDP